MYWPSPDSSHSLRGSSDSRFNSEAKMSSASLSASSSSGFSLVKGEWEDGDAAKPVLIDVEDDEDEEANDCWHEEQQQQQRNQGKGKGKACDEEIDKVAIQEKSSPFPTTKRGPPKKGGGHWMHYDDCCSYVQAQGGKDHSAWRAFKNSDKRPWNVPSRPEVTCEYDFTSNGEYYETHATHPNNGNRRRVRMAWVGSLLR